MERNPLQLAYEQTAIGQAFMDTLQQQIDNEKISDEDARTCMTIFYKSLANRFAEFNAQPDKIHMKFDGQLDMYRFCNNIWTLNCEKVKMDYIVPQSKVSKEGTNLAIVALEKKTHDK